MVYFTQLVGVAAIYASAVRALPVPGNPAPAYSAPSYEPSPMPMNEYKPPMNEYKPPMNEYKPPMNEYKPPMMEYKPSTSSPYNSYQTYAPPPPMYTTSKMMDTTTKKMMETTTKKMMETTSSTSAAMTYSTPSYGSGSWGGNGYNDCVSQCIANNGGMKMGSYEKPTTTMQEMGSKGTGATHTVIVAPSQGVLRYVPMAINASVGDTVKFMWGANGHTVTKGSALEMCNKTQDSPFASGLQNKSFVFNQVVTDTKPTYFFCAAPNHCQKGMFGIINPVNNAGSPTCAQNMMPKMIEKSSTVSSMNAYLAMMPNKSPAAMAWGNNLDMAAVPEWAQESMGENIEFTRTFLAANPDLIDEAGKIDLSKSGDAPFVVPKDLGSNLVSTVADTVQNATASAASVVASVVSSAISPSGTALKKDSGALSVRSSAGAVGVAAALAAFALF